MCISVRFPFPGGRLVIYLYKCATYPVLTSSLSGPYLLLFFAFAMERKKEGQTRSVEWPRTGALFFRLCLLSPGLLADEFGRGHAELFLEVLGEYLGRVVSQLVGYLCYL